MSPIARREGTRDMMLYLSEVDEELGDLEEILHCLTMGIPNMTTDEVLLAPQELPLIFTIIKGPHVNFVNI